jgi:hypothetical protein
MVGTQCEWPKRPPRLAQRVEEPPIETKGTRLMQYPAVHQTKILTSLVPASGRIYLLATPIVASCPDSLCIAYFLATNKAKRIENAFTLLKAVRSDSENHRTQTMTGNKSRLYYSYESPTMFRQGRDEVILRMSQTIGSTMVGHFTGFHPQAVSVHRHLQPFKINDQFF